MANWYCDPFDNPYKTALIDILGAAAQPDQLWNPDAVLRVEDIHHRPDTKDRLDKAAATQLVFEDAMIHVVDHLLRTTGASRLVLTGGVALNAVGNMRLLEHFDEAWFASTPATQGAAASVGAAGARRSRRHHRRRLAVRASGGRAARRADDARVLLRLAAVAMRTSRPRLKADDIASQRIGDISTPEGRDAIADLMAFMVAQNGVIALYQGAAETGPRALGHRSIFANPCDAEARERLNERVKYREAIRPLAPMATLEAAREYFELLPGASDADYNAYNYMVLTAQSKPRRATKFRPSSMPTAPGESRSCNPEDDPLTYAYLKALGRHIGVEISVNTSFNVAGPIAQTPQQAIDTLRRSKGLDAVVLVADDGAVHAAWHGGERDSGRFTGWFAEWNDRSCRARQRNKRHAMKKPTRRTARLPAAAASNETSTMPEAR